ncbi:MAG TPA: winged helix DNA-binding domain-containing protein [Candidatus Dormibacteraeota bacterium]|nr:winged helix DNA-binding domain-containing protein [Candidatus Dormibacteraeota bacterium]
MVEVVSEICCAHAQVGASAELMIGLRVGGITREDVRDALWRKRTLVKTVGLRGTLHLIPAGEVPMWMAANRLRFEAERKRYASLGMNIKNLDRLADAIADSVGPEPIDRPELERELASRVGELATTRNQAWAGNYPNWPLAMGFASARGHVCYGPGDGNRVTFVRLADWSGWRDEDPFESGLVVLRRYLHAYGPSTVPEFARWFSLDPAIARRLFAESKLVEVDVEGSRRWMLAEDAALHPPAHPGAVHLLPHFDVYVVGSHPRDQLMPAGSPLAAARLGTAAPFAVLLAGGRVAGVWERKPKGKNLRVRVGAHVPLSRGQRSSIKTQAERVAEILGLRCELEFGEVSLKRHL